MAAPNLKEIEWAIHELEQEESSESGYAMLAALYTCRKEMTGAPEPTISTYSASDRPPYGAEPLGLYGDSEFLSAVAGKDPAAAWAVMDKHMEAVKMLNPRAYNGVLRKLRQL